MSETITATALSDLADEYYSRTEEYDRTVCTGPVRTFLTGKDSILPANARELALINRNANATRNELANKAVRLGFTVEQFNEELRHASKRN